jgi:hypothetical protein
LDLGAACNHAGPSVRSASGVPIKAVCKCFPSETIYGGRKTNSTLQDIMSISGTKREVAQRSANVQPSAARLIGEIGNLIYLRVAFPASLLPCFPGSAVRFLRHAEQKAFGGRQPRTSPFQLVLQLVCTAAPRQASALTGGTWRGRRANRCSCCCLAPPSSPCSWAKRTRACSCC